MSVYIFVEDDNSLSLLITLRYTLKFQAMTHFLISEYDMRLFLTSKP